MSAPAERSGGRAPSVQPINVLRVSFPEVMYVRFLGDLRQLWTHYAKARPVVCFGAEMCPRERHKLPYRSKWYAPAQVYLCDEHLWRRVVVEVTEALERKLRDRSLRGETWCLKRLRIDKTRKQLDGDFIESAAPVTLPPAFDVDPILRRCFNELELPAPARNLLPDRPFSLDEEAPAPACLAADLAESMKATNAVSPSELRASLDALRSRLGTGGGAAPPGPRVPERPAVPVPSTNGTGHGKGGA